MNAERVEELRERARLTLDSIDDDEEPELWLFYTDLLALLDEKAAQLKAGVTVGAEDKALSVAQTSEGSIPSPGSLFAEDERREMLEFFNSLERSDELGRTRYVHAYLIPLATKIRALISARPAPVEVTSWHLHEWASGFDEDIAQSEQNLRDIFHEIGIPVTEEDK